LFSRETAGGGFSSQATQPPKAKADVDNCGISGAPSTVWSDTSVKSGTSYTYEVLARSATGETSAPSNVITVSIP
jgi:chitodextrinase